MDLTGGSYGSPEEKIMRERYDVQFGICEECGNIGVVLLNFHGEWICHKCAYSLMQSRANVENVNETH